MNCNKCGGMLMVIQVEEYPKGLKNKLEYDRLCDLECVECGRKYFSQPYDWGNSINEVRILKNEQKKEIN